MPDRVCKEVAGLYVAMKGWLERERGVELADADLEIHRDLVERGQFTSEDPLPAAGEVARCRNSVNAEVDFDKDGLYQPAVAEVHMSPPGCCRAIVHFARLIEQAH